MYIKVRSRTHSIFPSISPKETHQYYLYIMARLTIFFLLAVIFVAGTTNARDLKTSVRRTNLSKPLCQDLLAGVGNNKLLLFCKKGLCKHYGDVIMTCSNSHNYCKYVLPAGKTGSVENLGDGGWINWCFIGCRRVGAGIVDCK